MILVVVFLICFCRTVLEELEDREHGRDTGNIIKSIDWNIVNE